MAENSLIEWTTHTFNPWIGCTKVADGCTHCYAESYAKRYGKAKWGPQGTRVKTSDSYWKQPLKWNREAALYHASRLGPTERPRVFCASLADVFEDWDGPILDSRGNEIDGPSVDTHSAMYAEGLTMGDLRRELFALIDATPNLDWLLLTKRPENVRRMWPGREVKTESQKQAWHTLSRVFSSEAMSAAWRRRENVWLLTSVATQKDWTANGPHLHRCRDLVPVLGVSAEPLIGPVKGIWHVDWVIVGGESGSGARPMHPDWVRSILDQCQASGMSYFFKQWGEYAPVDGRKMDHSRQGVYVEPDGKWRDAHIALPSPEAQLMRRVGKKAAGRLLDGVAWSQFPSAAPPAGVALEAE